MVSRSWRSQTQRTPAGETVSPRFLNSLAIRTCRCRLLNGECHNGVFNVLRHAVLQHRLLAADLLQRQIAAFVVQLLETVEAVAAIAHHLASLADVAELLGKLEQSNLGADDLLFARRCPPSPRRGAAQPRPAPRPASAVMPGDQDTYVRLSLANAHYTIVQRYTWEQISYWLCRPAVLELRRSQDGRNAVCLRRAEG